MLQLRRRKSASRFWLLITLFLFLAVFGIVGWATAERAAQIAVQEGLDAELTDLYAFAFSYVLLFFLLASLPLLMVIGYHGLQGDMLTAKLQEHLSMAGLKDDQLRARMLEYQQSNGFSAFFLPILVNLLLLYVFWAAILLPHGIDGMLAYLSDGGTLKVGIAYMFPRIAAEMSLVTWALMGAYFYCLSVLIRRWMQSDLTTNVVWKLDVRLVITFVLGLLFSRMVGGTDADFSAIGPGITLLAFSIGIVPGVFLRWSARQLKRLGRVEANDMVRLFAPSELQRRIPGISFWQLDRLAEEGIESVQDLAMRSIPTLLIHTRFDTALLMSWVDRALLANQAGEQLVLFQRAHVHSATQLVARVQTEQGRHALLRSLEDAAEWERSRVGPAEPDARSEPPRASIAPVSDAQLDNILSGLGDGPNLRELMCYWEAVGTRHARSTGGQAGLDGVASTPAGPQ